MSKHSPAESGTSARPSQLGLVFGNFAEFFWRKDESNQGGLPANVVEAD